MKVIWEPQDIRIGRQVGHPGCNDVFVMAYHWRNEVFVLAYRYGYRKREPVNEPRFTLTEQQSQRIVCQQFTAADMAKVLNAAGYVPIEMLGEFE